MTRALSLLLLFFSILVWAQENEVKEELPDYMQWNEVIGISEIELSVRSINCLKNLGVETLGDLVTKTEEDLLCCRNFGSTSLEEIKKILVDKDLKLGMDQKSLSKNDSNISCEILNSSISTGSC